MKALLIVSIIMLCITQLLLPSYFIYVTGFRKSKSKTNLILKLLTVWPFFIYIFFTGRWDFLPYVLRYIFLLLLVGSTIKSLATAGELVWFEKKKVGAWFKLTGQVLFSALFCFLLVKVVPGFSTEEKGIDIAFPLKEGYIGHGGSSGFINYHNADSTSQQYALDITKLNGLGIRAWGFFPDDLKKYAIYGDTLFSPCDAIVVVQKDGLSNFPPGTESHENPAGNHIVLKYENNLIIFAHLLANSMMVSEGDTVKKGQPMARIGNSGHTSEPHLHIHAIEGTDTSKIIRGGNGIPIYFNGKFLTRNDRIKE
jgi:hypothetical protein